MANGDRTARVSEVEKQIALATAENAKELTEGLHKTALAMHGLVLQHENVEKRVLNLEHSVSQDANSLMIRVSLLESRLKTLEQKDAKSASSQTAKEVASVQSRATIIAAWIGAAGGVLAVIISLVFALKG